LAGSSRTANHRLTFVPFHVEVKDLFAEGDRVVSRWTFSGKQEKDFQGIPPTYKPVEVENIVIHRLANGKIVEAWFSYDALGLLQQLGAVPSAH
jgi:predicted ester cyclase